MMIGGTASFNLQKVGLTTSKKMTTSLWRTKWLALKRPLFGGSSVESSCNELSWFLGHV